METPDDGSQEGATTMETDGVTSEPISVLLEAVDDDQVTNRRIPKLGLDLGKVIMENMV